MKPRDSTYEPNVPIEYVYFPDAGVASVLTVRNDCTDAEVGTERARSLLMDGFNLCATWTLPQSIVFAKAM